MKQRILNTLILTAIVSCSSPDETKIKTVIKEVPVSTESVDSSKEEIASMDINRLVSYMSLSKETFDKAFPLLQSKLQQKDTRLEDEEAKKIADLLAVYSYDSENKLYTVLGLKSSKIGFNSISELNKVYSNLMYSNTKITKSMRSILIQNLNTTVSKFDSKYESKENLYDVVAYYKKVIKKEAKGTWAVKVFRNYSALVKILPEHSYEIFSPIFKDINLTSNSSTSNHLAYVKMLKEYIINNSSFNTAENKNILSSATQNIQWAKKQFDKNTIKANVLLETISNYFSLFDLNQIVTDKHSFRETINSFYFDTVKSIAPSLNKIIYRLDVAYLKRLRIHPYIKILINREQILKNLEPMFSFDDATEINELFHKERELFSSIDKSNNNKFIKDYYDVIAYKHSLELYTRSSGKITSNKNKMNSTYQKAVTSLLSALTFLYDVEVTKESLYSDNDESNELFQSIGNEYEEIEAGTFKLTYCRGSLINCPTKKLVPGVYFPPKGIKNYNRIEMHGAGLDMSPLAMIVTKGSDLLVSMQSIRGLWVDTTGTNGNQESLTEEQRGYIVSSVTGVSSKNEESKSKVLRPFLIPNVNRLSKGRFNKKTLTTTWTIQHDQGSQLKPQPKSNDGDNGGSVEIFTNYDFSISSVPLIRNSGGNGSNGSEGQSTKSKNSLTFNTIKKIGFDRKHRPYMHLEESSVEPHKCLSTIELKSGTMTRQIVFSSKVKSSIKFKSFDIFRGKGGDAGDGAQAGSLILTGPETEEYSHLFKNTLTTPGKGGIGGAAGECGAGDELEYQGIDGKDGEENE